MFQSTTAASGAPDDNFLPITVEQQTTNPGELRDMWVSHLLKQEERLEREFAERHPLQAALKTNSLGQ